VPLLIWHFTVDAIYTALLLLRSGNAYYVVSGAIASGILLLPLIVSGVLALRRGGFVPAVGLTNGDVGFVPAPPGTALPEAAVPSVRPLPRGARGVLAAIAIVLLATVLVPEPPEPPLGEDATGKESALRLGEKFLRANGVDPSAWRHVVYQGTGVDGSHSRVAVPTSPFLTPHDHAKGEARSWEVGRRVMVVTPVAAVMAALGGHWPDWPGSRERRKGIIRDAMYAELLGAFKALRADFGEYRRTHP